MLTRLRVGVSELPENVMTEVVAYPWNRLLADIGGSAGLILGISAFTIYTNIEGMASFIKFKILYLFLPYCNYQKTGRSRYGSNSNLWIGWRWLIDFISRVLRVLRRFYVNMKARRYDKVHKSTSDLTQKPYFNRCAYNRVRRRRSNNLQWVNLQKLQKVKSKKLYNL